MSCETCKELREENIVRITEIEIEGMHYHWSREIKYCPTCGKYISPHEITHGREEAKGIEK